MPRIIRQALYQKLRDLPELREFQRDFELLSGMKLAFVDELGLGDGLRHDKLPMCAAMHASEAGAAMCARTRHALFSQATDQPACAQCDAGLHEVAVPITISGIRAGFFVFGGTSPAPLHRGAIQRARHLLQKAGLAMDETKLEDLLAAAPVVPTDSLAAYRRVAHLAAKQIAMKITDQLVDPEAAMPPAVRKACGFIRSHAFSEDISLPQVARHCNVSEGHLSRIFHHATGLTFREYLTQVRVEHAKALLLHTGRSVTEIAYESGFQSISQFHRAFRKAHGVAPGQLRAGRAVT